MTNTEHAPENQQKQPSVFNGSAGKLRPENASPSTFILEVMDDSMTAPQGRSYPEGMLIYVDPEQCDSVVLGDLIIAIVSGQRSAVFKELTQEGDDLVLKSLNTHYPPIQEEFEVLGKVILGVQEE